MVNKSKTANFSKLHHLKEENLFYHKLLKPQIGVFVLPIYCKKPHAVKYNFIKNNNLFTSVGTTRGQEIIRDIVVVVLIVVAIFLTFSFFGRFLK